MLLQKRQMGRKKLQEMKLQGPESSRSSAAERENRSRTEVMLQMGLKTLQNMNLLEAMEAEAISAAKRFK